MLIQRLIKLIQLDADIQQGLDRIRDYDDILRLKLAVVSKLIKTARSLKLDRLSQVSTPTIGSPFVYHDTLSDEDDDSFELKSWHSGEVKTFITEPKLSARKAIGRQALDMKAKGQNSSNDPKEGKKELKSYKQGDFIARNKVLGPEARFYDALTEEELDRVDSILAMEDLFLQDLSDVTLDLHRLRV